MPDEESKRASYYPSLSYSDQRSYTGKLLPMQMISDRYLVLEVIAQGGMGAVYKVKDQRLEGKVVALKEVSEVAIAPEEREEVIASFQQEAELLARLTHPNLVRVTDLFEVNAYHYIVMEYIEGQTIARMMKSQLHPFQQEQVLHWAEQLCEVLHFLHQQTPPIIYRDIKPSNIMVASSGDQVKLIDFGIARFYKPGKKKDTIQFGTDGYAPPEQYGKAQTDARADVYALGVTLHQLLTFRDPATEPFKFPPVRKLNAEVDRHVEMAISKALDHNRENRHSDMETFWLALSNKDSLKHGSPVADISSSSDGKSTSSKQEMLDDDSSILSLGEVKKAGGVGQIITRELMVSPGAEAELKSDVPWISVSPERLEKDGGKVSVSIKTSDLALGCVEIQGDFLRQWIGWHTSRLIPAPREYGGAVVIERKDDKIEKYSISLTITPEDYAVIFRWGITLAALLLEFGLVMMIILRVWNLMIGI